MRSLSRITNCIGSQYRLYSNNFAGSIMKGLIAVCQLTSKNKKDENFDTCKSLIEAATKKEAQVIFLPECFDFIGESKRETLSLAETLDGPLLQKYKELAKHNNVWLSLGGFHEKISEEKVRNSHILVSSSGEIEAIYRKIHLFDVDIPEQGVRLKESDFVKSGTEVVLPVNSPVGKIGLEICYDMRFPELNLALTKMGAEIITFPSAFTFATGEAHWEIILRARAIETQSYVVAAAQTGVHNKKRSSWGHAMVVDPWGVVIAECNEGTGFAMAEIDLDYLKKVRRSMPVWNHRRYDMYADVTSSNLCSSKNDPSFKLTFPGDDETYTFGHASIKGSTVIARTDSTIAFTNKKCVVPGHVLVSPIRISKRLCELHPHEVSDLFHVVQQIQIVVEKMYKASSSTVAIQDGPDAGQTVQHLHVHVLPRKPGDFPQNDNIYHELQQHDKDTDQQWRSEDEMEKEAKLLRSCLESM